jgi:HupE / UreJ protein
MTARLLVVIALLLLGQQAAAHKASDSYLRINVSAERIEGQWDIALRDLDYAIGIDADGDGAITWGELRRRQQLIESYVLTRLSLRRGQQVCPLQVTGMMVDQHTDGAYAVLSLAARCAAATDPLTVVYGLLFDLDAQHRGLLRLQQAGSTTTAVFSPDHRQHGFQAGEQGGIRQLSAYAREGVWHIWIGYDHILFLLSLLLPAVLHRQGTKWLPVRRFGDALIAVCKVVTAFTLAHSLTLGLAVLGVIELPSRVVESAIALSVILVALNNLWPLIDGRRWLVALCFGLIHGLGFANVLRDLGLPGGSLLTALLGFNLGVEVGQLAIVAVLLPLTFVMRATLLYRRFALGLGSCAIVLIAALWLTERAFDLQLPVL